MEPLQWFSTEEGLPSQPTVLQIRHGTKAFVSTANRVLLVKEQHTDGSPFWTLPGGGVKANESLAECLTRELFEELRCQAVIDKPVTTVWYAHSSKQKTFSVYTVFECSLLSIPESNEREGILEYQWLSPTSLPPTTLPQIRQIVESRSR
ncbi:NUDIX hydrolase family protein [Halalkalicoccus jeotgali B3]|uniref:NUDIX hydrolase family protein n=1 Tax=Halalkalicoccus jeotgali (strain DSM 18796 / CECT 7217 / JCM 14584 / KCTC 4019 / B3) TaxID=795797 RepID=L9VCC5_HALJB|nr:NUDIX hydrolase family protein [Halalkalicoccus jeotgali B3]